MMNQIIIYSKSETIYTELNKLLTKIIQPHSVSLINKIEDLTFDKFNGFESILFFDTIDFSDEEYQTLINLQLERIKLSISVFYIYEINENTVLIDPLFNLAKDVLLRYPFHLLEMKSNLLKHFNIGDTSDNLGLKLSKNKPENSSSFLANIDKSILLKSQSNRYKMIEVIDSIPIAILISDRNGIIKYVNSYFCTITGYSYIDIIGQDSLAIMTIDNAELVVDEVRKSMRSRNNWKGELMNQRKNGSVFWSEVIIAPIIDQYDEIESYVATLTDFTEKIQTQTELEELCTQLQINELKALNLNKILLVQQEEMQIQKEELTQQKDQFEKQNIKLLQQRKSISASLDYALRIQQAMMAQQSELKDIFPNSFLFYLPRDFISGDFYWYRQIDENRTIIAAVDCTGHGIPGAFMSMLGSSLLSQIIEQNNIYAPAEILNLLDGGIVRALNQNITNNCDGMEVALLVINHATNEIQFAGAGLPLVYFTEGEMQVIKGSKRPIGGTQVPRIHKQAFVTHTINTQKGDSFYLFSDGYADQFDKIGKRKFLSKNFRNLLSQINQSPMEEQFDSLFEAFVKWKGKQKQTDDILVIGFSV